MAYCQKLAPMPRELEGMNMVTTFGAQAVYGRVLGVSEMRRMVMARRVVDAFQSRERYRDGDRQMNWAEWAEHYPEANNLLIASEVELAQCQTEK